jgi:UDP-GlcNAc:undecaprenyl-phosphate GlcNAc-1-phosphate transferase
MAPAAAFLAALFAALILTPLARALAWRSGYLDQPAARKLHSSATALLGGVAVFAAAALGWLVARSWLPAGSTTQALHLLGGAVLALAVGLWDDRFGMQPMPKLVGQAAAAAILLAAVPPLGLGLPAALEYALAGVAMVALMNAVNFLDNMNGMVAGMSAIILAAFAFHSFGRGAPGLGAAQLALAGACAGFLFYNFPKASIFLGDAGSLLLGYSLGASAVLAWTGAPTGWGRLGAALMLAYPAFDMIFVVVNRLRDGRKVYEGGKDHSNHRLASVLRCPKRTVILLWCSTAALCASGLAMLLLNQPRPALLLSAPWMVLSILSGLRLSSIPVPRPPRA